MSNNTVLTVPIDQKKKAPVMINFKTHLLNKGKKYVLLNKGKINAVCGLNQFLRVTECIRVFVL